MIDNPFHAPLSLSQQLELRAIPVRAAEMTDDEIKAALLLTARLLLERDNEIRQLMREL